MCTPPTWSGGEEEAYYATMLTKDTDIVLSTNVPRLIDDDISAIGAWYLADSTSLHPQESRADAHHLWSLALWDMAKTDATLFGCVALLTLQKKRTIASTFDKVIYLDHKQSVYRSLSKTLLTGDSNALGATALVMTLLSFVEVLEGRYSNAQFHVDAVAAMDFVRHLDAVQWRLIIWNDFRYAMKLAVPPKLCYYIPVFLTSATANIDGATIAEARRLALANLKHLRRCPDLDEGAWYSLFVSLHTISIVASSPASVAYDARLACAYEAEYRTHTMAARLAASGPHRSSSIMTLVVITCQLHILAVTSSFAPSTVECREILLGRARSVLDSLDTKQDMQKSRSQAVPMLWALTTLATHAIDGAFKGRQLFIQNLAATVDLKKLHSKATYMQILRVWPWAEHWHQSRVSAVWEDVLVGRGRRWRCISSSDTPENGVGKASGKFYAGILLFYES